MSDTSTYTLLVMSDVTGPTPMCHRQAGPHRLYKNSQGKRTDFSLQLQRQGTLDSGLIDYSFVIYSFKTQLLVILYVWGFVLDSGNKKDNSDK